MQKSPIKAGLKVQIEFNIGSKKNILNSFILESEHDRLKLSFPEEKREIAPFLREGTEIKAFIYTYSGIIVVESVVFDSPLGDNFVIEFNEEHQTIQRRQYKRVQYTTDLFIQINKDNIKTTTTDVSGGGVRFNLAQPLETGATYNIQLRIVPHEPMIKATGITIKKVFYKENEYVLEFVDIKEEDRKKIIKQCTTISEY